MRYVLLAVLCSVARLGAQDIPIVRDVVYGHKDGMALTMDVLKPAQPNGAAVCFIPTGGWYSVWQEPETRMPLCKPLLEKGFTVFLIYHGSAPKYNIPEIVPDCRRAIRFVHLKAKEFGIDAERIGVWGGSAGGHLTLVLATTADDGDPKAKDKVLRQSDRIAAAVALFPPTDLRDWVKAPPESIRSHPAMKPLTFEPAKAKDFSPLLHVTEKTPPTLLIHGDKDMLVPISHSTTMIEALEKSKIPSKLITIKGAGHGFGAKQNADVVVPALVGWFEKHLAKKD